jgi:2'-5' RNA ligase
LTRLFVAVWPPESVLATLAAMARPAVDGMRWTTRDQWHVTLRFLGDCDVAAARDALARVDAAPTAAVMGPATARFGNRVLHVPVAGLDDVARAVIGASADVGDAPEDRVFHGHLTLARARDRRGVDLRRLCAVAIAGEWPVAEITLVASTLDPKGARYEIVERYPLK